MSEMLTITIDGVECTCEKGEYLYDVAARNGIWIPVLCRSDAFDDHRACCRICIVEVEIRGKRKVVTACVYPIEQECAVYTKSEKILEERAVIMALLAHRAPDSERMAYGPSEFCVVLGANASTLDIQISSLKDVSVVLSRTAIGNNGFLFAVNPADGSFIYYKNGEEVLTGQSALEAGLTEAALRDGYAGIETIKGVRYYCVSRTVGEQTVVPDEIPPEMLEGTPFAERSR